MDGFRGLGLATTWLVHALLLTFVFSHEADCGIAKTLGCGGGDAEAKLGKEEIMIEAAIAYKKPEEEKQPQKKRQKKKSKKQVKVSRDEEKVPEKEEKREDDPVPSFKDFMRDEALEPENPDLEEGEEAPKPDGKIDGKEFGWGDEDKGPEYVRELARLVRFEIPTLEKGTGEVKICIRLDEDGTIAETRIDKSGNANIDRSAEEALRRMQEARDEDEDVEPVPSELEYLTEMLTCFRPTQ